MNHPNAFAAALAGAVTIGAQWLVQRYAHAALSDYWKTALDSAVTVAVLYVGKHGLRAAISRILNGPKTIWTGAPSAAASKTGRA